MNLFASFVAAGFWRHQKLLFVPLLLVLIVILDADVDDDFTFQDLLENGMRRKAMVFASNARFVRKHWVVQKSNKFLIDCNLYKVRRIIVDFFNYLWTLLVRWRYIAIGEGSFAEGRAFCRTYRFRSDVSTQQKE